MPRSCSPGRARGIGWPPDLTLNLGDDTPERTPDATPERVRACDDRSVHPTEAPPAARRRLPLRRPPRARWFGGVALGLAAHLDVPVGLVRAAFIVLTPVAAIGPLLYVFWWLAVPQGDPADAAQLVRPSALTRLARRQAIIEPGRRVPITDIAIGAVLVIAAALLIAVRSGADVQADWILPTIIVLSGLWLAWSQLDAVQRGRLRDRAGGRTPVSVLRVAGGILLAGVGVLLFVGMVSGQGVEVSTLVQSIVAALVMLGGVALVLTPWWLRLVRELGDERAARARESERADIAAHLHDSVLQTLALIRSRSDDSAEVARMARAQERELREWLYDDRPAPGTSVAAALRGIVAEVEDSRSGPTGVPVAIESVVVGDRVPDADTEALLQATREALVNAVVHGRPPVSLYLEVGTGEVEVFVRDHGDGFDLDEVGTDRFGVRESIIGRVRRRGGTATVTSSPERGTEVHLVVPISRDDEGQR
ncbi:PspC domain-containing protein [Cellulomonas sp. zg-ZUI188]|uniref:PspC domain-containing protein n=1 Tax=Cellulomonas fengjieae TaxID=2819978 RepID=A0ABS3SD13_9CELL|nr:PspC domain-containing protein [Cellulomonas fengjieae]MBO3101614.1 PspC domain-containing protein [Cellulomonas fengjieae]QVI67964.1 PspC domain-containing protein [Cellulomonas fengjieae]